MFENDGKLWTKGDLQTLKAMYVKGSSYRDMAITLGRTITAVYSRLNSIRFAEFYFDIHLDFSETIKAKEPLKSLKD